MFRPGPGGVEGVDVLTWSRGEGVDVQTWSQGGEGVDVQTWSGGGWSG